MEEEDGRRERGREGEGEEEERREREKEGGRETERNRKEGIGVAEFNKTRIKKGNITIDTNEILRTF
jgi:hypothetical protein